MNEEPTESLIADPVAPYAFVISKNLFARRETTLRFRTEFVVDGGDPPAIAQGILREIIKTVSMLAAVAPPTDREPSARIAFTWQQTTSIPAAAPSP